MKPNHKGLELVKVYWNTSTSSIEKTDDIEMVEICHIRSLDTLDEDIEYIRDCFIPFIIDEV